VSAGKYMNPTGGNYGYYKWKEITANTYTGDFTDSIRVFSVGSYICTANSKANWSSDTISILEKPTMNTTTKMLSFPTAVSGITYKLLKVSTIFGTDTTWTTAETYVGDGAAKSFTLADGTYKLTTTFGIHTATYPYSYFVVGTSTAVQLSVASLIIYRQVGGKLIFNRSVRLRYYNLQGSLILQGEGSEFTLPVGTVVLFECTDNTGYKLSGKVGF
jgi:hypothetical protein